MWIFFWFLWVVDKTRHLRTSSWASRNIFPNFYDILQTLLMDESSKIIDSDNSWSSQPWYVRQTDSRYKYSERFQAFLPEISRKIRDIELLRGQIQEPKSSSGIKKTKQTRVLMWVQQQYVATCQSLRDSQRKGKSSTSSPYVSGCLIPTEGLWYPSSWINVKSTGESTQIRSGEYAPCG